MATNNPFSELFSPAEFSKLFENYQSLPFDLKDFLETQRKNIQTLSEAQQLSMENLQAIAQRQSEILSKMVEDNATIAKELMAEGTPEEKMAKNADLFKNMYERSVKNMNELAGMMNKSGQETTSLINKRVSATMNEVKASLEKSQKKAA